MSRLDLIRNTSDRERARAVADELSGLVGEGVDSELVDSYVISALADLHRRGATVTTVSLGERVKAAMRGDDPLTDSDNVGTGEIYDAATSSASNIIPIDHGDGFVGENRRELQVGRGRIGPETGRISNLPPTVEDPSIGDAIADTAGTFIWGTLDALSMGLMDFGLNKLMERGAAEGSFLDGMLDAADDFRRADTEAGKYGKGIGEGLGIIVPFLASGGLAGLARAGVGAGKAAKGASVLGKIGQAAPANLAFSAGRKIVTKAATKGAKTAVKAGVKKAVKEGVETGVTKISSLDEALESLAGLKARRKEIVDSLKASVLSPEGKLKLTDELASVESKISQAAKGIGDMHDMTAEAIIRSVSDDVTKATYDTSKLIKVTEDVTTKNVDRIVEAVYNTRKGMSSGAIKDATKKILSRDAEMIFKARAEKALAKEITDPVLRSRIIEEVSKNFVNLMDDAGQVRHLGEIFAKSPILSGVSERVGRILQNFGEEAIGFAVHGAGHRLTESLAETPDVDNEKFVEAMKEAGSFQNLKGDVRTAFIFATGGGVLVPGAAGALGFLPMKAFFPGRSHESLGKAMRKIFGGAVDDYRPMHDSISQYLGKRLNDAKRLGKVNAILNRKGSPLDPTRLMHAAELDYKALAESDPEALYLISKMVGEAASKTGKNIKGFGKLAGGDPAFVGMAPEVESMRAWLEGRIGLSESALKAHMKAKPKSFKKAAEALQEMAEDVVMADRALIKKTFGMDLLKNFTTGLSIAFSGNPFSDDDGDGIGDSDLSHMIHGIESGTMHMSNLIPHLAFSFMSASHPLYHYGMGNWTFSQKSREIRIPGEESTETLSLTELRMNEIEVANRKRLLGMGDDRFMQFADQPNQPRIALADEGAREAAKTVLERISNESSAIENVMVHTTGAQAIENSRKLGSEAYDWTRQTSLNEAIVAYEFLREQSLGGARELEPLREEFSTGDIFTRGNILNESAKAAIAIKKHLVSEGIIVDPVNTQLSREHIINLAGEFSTKVVRETTAIADKAIQHAIDVLGDPLSAKGAELSMINIDLPKEEIAKLVEDRSIVDITNGERSYDDAAAALRVKARNLVDLAWLSTEYARGEMKTITTAEEFKKILTAVNYFESEFSGKFRNSIEGLDDYSNLTLDSGQIHSMVYDSIAAGAAHISRSKITDNRPIVIPDDTGDPIRVRFGDTVVEKLKQFGVIRQEGRDNRFSVLRFERESVAHLEPREQAFIRNLIKVVGMMPNTRISADGITREHANKINGKGTDSGSFIDASGNAFQKQSVIELMKSMQLDLSDSILVSNTMRHLAEVRASGLSRHSYMVFSALRDLGIITDSSMYGTTFHIPIEADINIENPGELAKRMSSVIEKLGAGEYAIDAQLLGHLEGYIREWKKVGLLNNISTGRNGMEPEGGSYAVFTDPAGRFKRDELVRLLEALEMRTFALDTGVMGELVSFAQRIESDPKYREEMGLSFGDKEPPKLSYQLLRMMDSNNPYMYAKVRSAMLDAGIIKLDNGRLQFSPEQLSAEAAEKMFKNYESIAYIDSLADHFVRHKESQYRAEGLFNESRDIWESDKSETYSVSELLSDIGRQGDREFVERMVKASQSDDPITSLRNELGKEAEGISELRLTGLANELRGRRLIEIITWGDSRAPVGAPGEPASVGQAVEYSPFTRSYDTISRGWLTGLMDRFGYDVAVLGNIADIGGQKIDLFGSSEAAKQARNRLDKLFGGVVTSELRNGSMVGEINRGEYMVPVYIGDLSSVVLHKMPDLGRKDAFAANVRAMIASYGDGPKHEYLKKALKDSEIALTAIENAKTRSELQDAYNANFQRLRSMSYLMQFHHMLGVEGVSAVLNKSSTEADIGKEISRYRQANSRSSTATDPVLFERILSQRADSNKLSRSTVLNEDGSRSLRVIIVDDAATSPGEAVSRYDSNVFQQMGFIEIQANLSGAEYSGVLKNSVGLFGDQTLLTKQAGAYNKTFNDWMEANDIAMVITKSAAKAYYGFEGKVADFGGIPFDKAMRDGIPMSNDAVIHIPVDALKVNKVPHDKKASIGFQIENWMPQVGEHLNALFADGINRVSSEWESLFSEFNMNTPYGRIKAREIATRAIQGKFGEGLSIDDLRNLPLSTEYLMSSNYGSPMDLMFGRSFLDQAKRSLVNQHIFKMSSKGGKQSVLGVDSRGVINAGEAMASPDARNIVHNLDNTIMAIGLLDASGNKDYSRAETDMTSWGGWAGSKIYYNNGGGAGKTHFVYRDLMKKVDSTGAKSPADEGFVYRYLLEQYDGLGRKGLAGDLSWIMKPAKDAAHAKRIAAFVNNMIVDALRGESVEGHIKKLSNASPEYAEMLVDLVANIAGNARKSSPSGSNVNFGELYDGLASAFGRYGYESRSENTQDGLTSTSWGFVGMNQRYPSAKPNDTIATTFLGFLGKEYGRQYVLNWDDAIHRGEADYDIDTFNYWFNSPRGMVSEFARIRSASAPVQTAKPHTMMSETANTRGLNPFSHSDMERYAMDQAESARLRGSVIKSGKIVEKMVNDQIGVRYTAGSKVVELAPKWKSSQEVMDESPDSIAFISKMVQEIIDSKSGLLPRTKRADSEVYYGMDPFKSIIKQFFSATEYNKSGVEIGARELSDKEVEYLAAAMLPYAKLLRMSKQSWDGDASKSMGWEEMVSIVSEYMDDSVVTRGGEPSPVYGPNYESNMTRRMRSVLRDESDVQFFSRNPKLGINERAAGRIMLLANMSSRESHLGWNSVEESSVKMWVDQLTAKTDADTAVRLEAENVARFGTYRRAVVAAREELASSLISANYRAANGDRFAQFEARQLARRLKYANELVEKAREAEQGLLEVNVGNNRFEKERAARAASAAMAIRYSLMNLGVSPQYTGELAAHAAQIRKIRGNAYREYYQKLADGADVTLSSDVQIKLQKAVDAYMRTFASIGENGDYSADLAVLMLAMPDIRGRSTGSFKMNIYKSVPQDLLTMALNHPTVSPSTKKRILSSLARSSAVVSAVNTGDPSAVAAVSNYVDSRLEGVIAGRALDRLNISSKAGLASVRMEAIQMLTATDPAFNGAVDIASRANEKRTVGGINWGAVTDVYNTGPDAQFRRLRARASMRYNLDGTKRSPYEDLISTLYQDNSAALILNIAPEVIPSEYIKGIRAKAERAVKESESGKEFDEKSAEFKSLVEKETRKSLARLARIILGDGPALAGDVKPFAESKTLSFSEEFKRERLGEECR